MSPILRPLRSFAPTCMAMPVRQVRPDRPRLGVEVDPALSIGVRHRGCRETRRPRRRSARRRARLRAPRRQSEHGCDGTTTTTRKSCLDPASTRLPGACPLCDVRDRLLQMSKKGRPFLPQLMPSSAARADCQRADLPRYADRRGAASSSAPRSGRRRPRGRRRGGSADRSRCAAGRRGVKYSDTVLWWLTLVARPSKDSA